MNFSPTTLILFRFIFRIFSLLVTHEILQQFLQSKFFHSTFATDRRKFNILFNSGRKMVEEEKRFFQLGVRKRINECELPITDQHSSETDWDWLRAKIVKMNFELKIPMEGFFSKDFHENAKRSWKWKSWKWNSWHRRGLKDE
jgi:hypothetical protein